MKIFFICIFIFLFVALCAVARFVFKSKSEYRKDIVRPIIVSLFTLIFYTIFSLADNSVIATFFGGLYFVCTDWLCITMLMFAFAYANQKNRAKYLPTVLVALSTIDSISLLVNTFTHHSFYLTREITASGFSYWLNHLNGVHWLHLGLCYVQVGLTFVVFLVAGIKATQIYKRKYFGAFIAYSIVIIANFISYTIGTPIDISILLYVFLACFLGYYSVYRYPKQIIINSLYTVDQATQTAMYYFDADGSCIFVNQRAQEMLKLLGKPAKQHAESYREKIIKQRQLINKDFDTWNEDALIDGDLRQFDVEYRVLRHGQNQIGSYVKFSDKTEEVNQYLKEKYLAIHDELTGLYNQQGFFEVARNALDVEPTEEWILVCSNIKNFKLINDLFGESLGDTVLKCEANLIQARAHSENVFGRMAGDKFAMLMKKKYFNEEIFKEPIETVCALTEKFYYKMHIWISVYEIHDTRENVQSMYYKCLMAIPSNSEDYQKTFLYYDSVVMERLLEEKNIVADFDNALSTNQFKMYFQAQADRNKKVLGGEALVRWHHNVRGILQPNEFIQVLEKAGIVYKLDKYIWEEAAKKIKEWKDIGIEDRYISVNVSARDFYFVDLYETFLDLVTKYQIKPQNLNIEITETVLMHDFSKSLEVVSSLHKEGFKIEIDDFGSGYSSLNMLKEIPADVLKIDMMFLRETENKERSRAILASVLSMAHELEMKVICEGIETAEQFELLSSLGCDLFQGYYFSRPIPMQEFEKKFL